MLETIASIILLIVALAAAEFAIGAIGVKCIDTLESRRRQLVWQRTWQPHDKW